MGRTEHACPCSIVADLCYRTHSTGAGVGDSLRVKVEELFFAVVGFAGFRPVAKATAARTNAKMFFENVAEVRGIIKAPKIRDFCDTALSRTRIA